MDEIIFYQPALASKSQPPRRLTGTVTSATLPGASITSLTVHQTASQPNQQNEMLNVQMTKFRDGSDLSLKSRLPDQHPDQGKLTAMQNFLDSDDGDELPSIDELFSGLIQKEVSTIADLDGDDIDGFVDVDEFLSSMKQQSMSACAIPNSHSMTEMEGSRICGDSASSSRSTESSIQDPIILSDDEATGSESETDYGDLNVDHTAKSNSESPHGADRWLADGDSFASGDAFTTDRFVTDHQDHGNNNNTGVVDGAKLQLAVDRLILASPDHGSFTHQATPLQVNTEIINKSASYVDLDVIKEVEDGGIDVFAKEDVNNDADARPTRRPRSSAISCNDTASDSDVSDSELQDDRHGFAQSSQSGPAVASLQESDLTNDPLPRHRRQQDATGNLGLKRQRTPILTGLASTAGIISATSKSNNLKETQSVALLAAPGQERKIRDIDKEMVDDGGTDDSNDEDYNDMSDVATSEIQDRPRSRKRVRWAKNTEDSSAKAAFTHHPNVSCQAFATASSGSMQESEEIPIHGYLTLKTIESKVVYCLTFSQELLPKPSGLSQTQVIIKGASSSCDSRDSERLSVQERVMSRPLRSRFSPEDNELLLQLKGDGLSWDEISDYFPERSKGTLQVHYSTKLKPRSETSKGTKKRWRSE